MMPLMHITLSLNPAIIKPPPPPPPPLTKLKKKYAKQAPWVSSGLRASIMYKNKLHRKSLTQLHLINQNILSIVIT